MKHIQNFAAGFIGTAFLTALFFGLILYGLSEELHGIAGIVYLIICTAFGIINTVSERNNP